MRVDVNVDGRTTHEVIVRAQKPQFKENVGPNFGDVVHDGKARQLDFCGFGVTNPARANNAREIMPEI